MNSLTVIVAIKRVIDSAMKVKISQDRTGIDLLNMKMSINPYCEVALEQTVQFKEKFSAQTIAISIGPKGCQDSLRTALAVGVDRAIHIHIEDKKADNDIQPLTVAKILKQVVFREKANLVLMGQQSIDGNNSQTGPMLASLLSWPQGTFITKIESFSDDNYLQIERETDTGMETLQIPIPAVLTTSLRLNRPRFATLTSILKAKKKSIEMFTPEDLGLAEADLAPRNEVLSLQSCPPRKSVVMLQSVDDLLHRLKVDGIL